MPSSYSPRARAAIPAALLVLLALLAVPALASAASVKVASAGNRTTLEFTGGAGEDRLVIGPPGTATPGALEVVLTDETASLTAGAGCTGGGGAGTPATCKVPPPSAGVSATSLDIDLGAGADRLEALAFTGPAVTEVGLEVSGGEGNDKIETGATPDTVDPGPGADQVETNSNNDRVLAGAAPSGDDSYDLGPGFDQVSYMRRSSGVVLAGNVVSGGAEDDVLEEVEAVVGSPTDDSLETSTTIHTLDGGPGNDLLSGGEENDTLFGGLGDDTLAGNGGEDILEGGEGNDAMSGGPGDDRIDEDRQEAEAEHTWVVGLAPGQTGGDDTADGGEGNDQIDLGPGRDHAEGGGGIDLIFGGPEDDELNGGPGDDGIAGEGGSDVLNGGPGFDEILAGHLFEPRFEAVQPVDTWRDTIDCGPNFDVAVANRWDSLTGCEEVRTVPILEVRRVKRNVRQGTARLAIALVGPGTLSTLGGSVKAVSRNVAAPAPEKRSAVMVPITLRGPALRTLKRHGHVTVRFGLVLTPPIGFRRTEPVKVTLSLHPAKKKGARKARR